MGIERSSIGLAVLRSVDKLDIYVNWSIYFNVKAYNSGSKWRYNPFMKFCLYPVLFVVLMMPFSISSETDNAKEDETRKTERSIWQRIFPRTGDMEGTIYQHDTDTPLVEAEVRIVETDQYQNTGKDGTFRFTEIPIGVYTLSISHPIYSTPTEIPIEIHAG